MERIPIPAFSPWSPPATTPRLAAARRMRAPARRFAWVFIGFGLALLIASTASQAGQRMALVLGNSHYEFGALENVANDTAAFSQRLQALGFEVLTASDLDQSQTYNTLLHFLASAAEASEVLFFYAGHALQVNGRNYIVPLDARIGSSDLVFTLVDLRFFTERLEGLSARTKLIILDACRDNPFARAANASGGLAEMNAPLGTLIAFSTAPGYTAEDGSGRHSPYMGALLEALDDADASVEEVFKTVRSKVVANTGGRQIPWESTSLITSFRFAAPAGGTLGGPGGKPGGAGARPAAALCPNCTCASLFTKLSLGLEGLTRHEQEFLQKSCR